MIQAEFQSILVPENNGQQNPKESLTNKYQKHISCSYEYKLVCEYDNFSKPFKTYLGRDAFYNFIKNMVEESKYCSEVMKKLFNKELVMTKENHENFKNSTKCWICDNYQIDNDVQIKYHCHGTGKYRGCAHRECIINVKLNHGISAIFCNLKKLRFSSYYGKTRQFQS